MENDNTIQYWCEYYKLKVNLWISMDLSTEGIKYRLKEEREEWKTVLPLWKNTKEYNSVINMIEALDLTLIGFGINEEVTQ